MSAETFTTAMFLIVAVISAGVMVNAIFPVVHTFTQSVTSSSHSAEERISTDIKIINTFADSTISSPDPNAKVWIKNVGSNRISENELQKADLYIGAVGDFDRVPYNAGGGANTWRYTIEGDTNNYWDPMETITLEIQSSNIPSGKGGLVYFAFTMPNGIFRKTEFTTSA